MRSITAFRFTTFCWLLGTFIKTSAAQYEVDGQIEQTIYNVGGSVQSEGKSRFTVFVNDCSWLIQTTNFDADGTPLTVNETASTNGGLIYSISVPISRDSTAAGRFGGTVSTVIQANIYSNNVPVGEKDGDDVGHLWLMFASGCHLKHLSTNRLTPVYDLNTSASMNRSLKRQAKWELADGLGSLPTNVTFFQSDAESPIDATYVTTGVTNAGNLRIASGFVFEQRVGVLFAPGPIMPGDATPAYHIRKRAAATVTAVRPYCSRKKFVPTTTGMTQVNDERLVGVPSSNPRMFYVFPDGVRWVSVEEAKRLVAARSLPSNPPSKAIVVVVLLLPAVVVFFLWLLNRSKRQTEMNSVGGDPPEQPLTI